MINYRIICSLLLDKRIRACYTVTIEKGELRLMYTDAFYLDIARIHLVHDYTLDRTHRCHYPLGRGHYGLVFALSGQAEYRFSAGEWLTVAQGDAIFLSPTCVYSIAAEKEFRHYTVNFDIHEASSDRHALGQPYCLLQKRSTEALERSFRELVDVWSSKKPGYDMRAVGCLYELMAEFYFAYFHEQHAASRQRLLPARQYIEQHFEDALTLGQLAFLCAMSITNFRREWKKHYTESPIQYRDRLRLQYAKEYLSSGYYTVTEIAEKCGFDDASYFVRFFKQKTGLTPGNFKKQFFGKPSFI